MAEGLFKHMLKENNITNINIDSAGISVFPGERANEKAIKALLEKGIDIREHRANQLSDKIKQADLILTMTLGHKEIIEAYFKEKAGVSLNIYTLKEFAAKLNNEKLIKTDINDPYGMDFEVYKKTRDEIEKELNKILNKINKLEEIWE